MDIEVIEKAYRRYAQGYDLYFGALLQPGRRAVVRRMDSPARRAHPRSRRGHRLSLPLYPHDVQVTGIDVSPRCWRAPRRVASAATWTT